MKLTTQQIITTITAMQYPSWEWQEKIETCTGLHPEDTADAISSARFLEKWMPGETWTADEFSNLFARIEGGRWASAAEVGAIRAHEDHEDGNISDARLAEAIASDAAAASYVTDSKPGTHVFLDEDGTVLVFGDLSSRSDLERG